MKHLLPLGCAALMLATALSAETRYDPQVLPKGREYFELRDGLANCRLKFEREKTGRIAFLGGSITAGGGWRDHTIRYFQAKFPQTKFDFISAGISSLGSVPHAFRLQRDVLSQGPVDLLFVEAAVNDSTNTAEAAHMLRGMEGVVRHMRLANPLTDIVHLHFVMPEHMTDYHHGQVPVSIAQHEQVALAYGNVTLNLSLEVTDRIQAGEFTWDRDFQGLHPSPFGHQLYGHSIARLLNAAFAQRLAESAKPHPLPAPVDRQSYFRGRFGNISEARILRGFTLEQAWKPSDKKGTRAGFVDVPALVGSEPGAEFEFRFDGTGAGLFIASGPDAGRIEFSIDGADYRLTDTFTQWSPSLHLPWAVILDDGLKDGPHTVKVRIAAGHDAKGSGTALRVFHLLLN
jgi:sialidase-1